MGHNPENIESRPRILEEERYDSAQEVYLHIIHYRELAYDLRSLKAGSGNAVYRRVAEKSHVAPGCIEVDKEGYIVEEWD